MMENLFLFIRIAGTPVAIESSAIDAVVRLGEIIPVARTPIYVRGLAALRSRVVTVIDSTARITGMLADLPASPHAVVTQTDGHGYAILVDEISDITAVEDGVQPVRGHVDPVWSPFVRGMIVHEGKSFLALSVSALTQFQVQNQQQVAA
jgi:purine-binding chemotaxis protein CheW